jgi:hypothetical protein
MLGSMQEDVHAADAEHRAIEVEAGEHPVLATL